MKFHDRFLAMFAVALTATAVSPAVGQVLYSQNFDVDDSANWTVNSGPSDEAHNFFYDYSALGIPSAPNSTGGSTRGMQLQANVFNGIFSGMSVSPNGQSFTGDYTISFDWWQNYFGPLAVGATGSTMLSQFGIQTSGTSANWPGASTLDGTYFASTGDGQSGADLRIYSPERTVSYQLPHNLTVLDMQMPPQPVDSHATYLGGTRNSNVAPYTTAFPGGQSAPAFQQTTYPDTQTGTTSVGAAGFQWNEMEIRKVGNLVRLFANGTELMNVDMTHYVVPNGGTNILFGHSDINATTNIDPNFAILQFSLFDNVVVSAAVAPPDADLDNDNDVDGNDLLLLQQGTVDAAGYAAFIDQFGDGGSAAAAAGAVPEPSTWALAALAGAACLAIAAPRRRAALARVHAGR